MRLPELSATTPFRAWALGLIASHALIALAGLGPFVVSFYGLPLVAAALSLYALTVRPRAFAASGVLFGALPWLTWGIVDGLEHCAAFNRSGGFCEADASAQVMLALGTYIVTVVVTATAFRRRLTP